MTNKKHLFGLIVAVALIAFWMGTWTANGRSDEVNFVNRATFDRLAKEALAADDNTVYEYEEITNSKKRARVIVKFDMFSSRPFFGSPATQYFVCDETEAEIEQ